MLRCSSRVAAGVFVLAGMLCVPAVAGARVVADASGRRVAVADTSRVLAIGGDVTEILYALKADANIIAVDSTSQFPADALKEKKNVGYMRALSAEGALSVNPSVIIASAGAGPPEVVSVLKASSVPYVEVSDDRTPESVAAKVRFVASVVGAETQGDLLAKEVEDDFATLARQRSKIGKPVRALFVLTVQNGRATVGGARTSADAIIRLAGAENAAAQIEGYKPLSDEAAIELAPDAIVTMQHGVSTFQSDQILSVNGLKSSPAGEQRRIIEMDGLCLLGFGPRASRAARELMRALYPDLPQSRAGAAE